MAKKTVKKSKKTGTDAETKRKWLATNRKKFGTAGEAVAGLKNQFGSALGYAEIANILEIAVGTVKSSLSQAVRQLRGRLQQSRVGSEEQP